LYSGGAEGWRALTSAQLQQEERACKWSSEPANIKVRAEQMMDQQSENHSAMYVY